MKDTEKIINKYFTELQEDFVEFLTARIHTQSSEEYKKKEQSIILKIRKYIKETKKEEMEIDDIFDIFVELLMFTEYRAYKTGLQDGIYLRKQTL